jgi:predicted RNA-binding protein
MVFHKKVDLYAYDIRTDTVNDRSIKLKEALLKRLKQKGITIRPINLKDYKNEVNGIEKSTILHGITTLGLCQ